MSEQAVECVRNRMAKEGGYRTVLFRLLRYCQEPRTFLEVQQAIFSYPEMKTAVLEPAVLLRWLEQDGGLTQVNDAGQPGWVTTEAGRQAADLESPDRRLQQLILREPEREDLYLQVIRFCTEPKLRYEIEEMLDSVLAQRQEHVHPVMFVQRLEKAGGLEWIDKHWRSTQAARELLS